MNDKRRLGFSFAFWVLGLALGASALAVAWWMLHLAGTHRFRQGDGRHPESYGFALGNFSLDRGSLVASGLPRDGIPALADPTPLSPKALPTLGRRFLLPSDPVAGVVIHGQARAYPLRVLVFHELVNDQLANEPILVVHQPLCGLTAVLSRKVQQRTLTFGHSGLLWNSCGLFFDRESQSLWLPLAGAAVAGPAVSQKLQFLPFTLTTWERWQQKHPQTTLVQPDLSRLAQYKRDPYSSYLGSDLLRFPVKPQLPAGYRRKAPLLVFNPGTQPFAVFAEAAHRGPAVFSLPGSLQEPVELVPVGHPPVWEVSLARPEKQPSLLYVFAFAWYALHPEQDPQTWFQLPRQSAHENS